MKKKLKQSMGKVVTGEWFWDREKDKELFIEKIDEGAHLLLVAQRRMGKTSLMAEVTDMLQDRYICLFVDVQKCQSSSDAIAELSLKMHRYKSVWDKAKGVFSNVLGTIESVQLSELGITLRSGLNAGNWAGKGEQLLDILSAADKPVVVMFDELPIMMNRILKDENHQITSEGRRQADEFMSWLRKNSIKHQGKVRIVLSGSIGLEPILHQARLSATINNFVPFEVKPWDERTAVGCIEALANEYDVKLGDGVPEEMVNSLGCCIPHHVQMFFSHMYDRCVKRGKMVCSIEDVGEVYEKDMLGVRGHVELTHYEERLEKVLDKELCALALDMLTEAAVTGWLSKEAIKAFQDEYLTKNPDVAEAQKEILRWLEHDGYIKQNKEGYVFESTLLRDWWEKMHGRFFTPVLERGTQRDG
jgi:hypothetical protein